jgi:hypothetical protein
VKEAVKSSEVEGPELVRQLPHQAEIGVEALIILQHQQTAPPEEKL